MEYFITQIKIGKIRHLTDITIDLNVKKRQHLILTDKNSSGKTSVFSGIRDYCWILREVIMVQKSMRNIKAKNL